MDRARGTTYAKTTDALNNPITKPAAAAVSGRHMIHRLIFGLVGKA
jgi:hypothetical protein